MTPQGEQMIEIEGTCEDCKWWDIIGSLDDPYDHQLRLCTFERVGASETAAREYKGCLSMLRCLGEPEEDGVGLGIWTGPDFGCVHFVEKASENNNEAEEV